MIIHITSLLIGVRRNRAHGPRPSCINIIIIMLLLLYVTIPSEIYEMAGNSPRTRIPVARGRKKERTTIPHGREHYAMSGFFFLPPPDYHRVHNIICRTARRRYEMTCWPRAHPAPTAVKIPRRHRPLLCYRGYVIIIRYYYDHTRHYNVVTMLPSGGFKSCSSCVELAK